MVTINKVVRSTEVGGILHHEAEYKGLSTDAKPTDCLVNSIFLELDTGDIYYFIGGSVWVKVGEQYKFTATIIVNGGNGGVAVDYEVYDDPQGDDPIASGTTSGGTTQVADVPLGAFFVFAKEGDDYVITNVEGGTEYDEAWVYAIDVYGGVYVTATATE